MTRGPRALRREVLNARGVEAAPLGAAGLLSDCLREAGAEVVAKGSANGSLQRTDLSRTSLTIESSERTEIEALKAQLDEKTRSLKALQRNYDSVSSVGATDRNELTNLRKVYAEVEQELHNLQKDNDRLGKELQVAREDIAGKQADTEQSKQQLAQKVAATERKSADLQAALDAGKCQNQQLQELLRAQRSTCQALEKQAQEAGRAGERARDELAEVQAAAQSKEKLLKDAEVQLMELRQRCATLDSEMQGREGTLQSKLHATHEQLQDVHAKWTCAEEKLARQQAELQEQRAETQKLGTALAQCGIEAEAAHLREQAGEARLRELDKQREDEVMSLRAALDEQRALVAAVRKELTNDQEGRAAAEIAHAAAEQRLQEAEALRRQQQEESQLARRRELADLQAQLAAAQGVATDQLQAEKAKAVHALEEQIRARDADFERQQKDLDSLAAERQRLAEEASRLAGREREAGSRAATLEGRGQELTRELEAERRRAGSLEDGLREAKLRLRAHEAELATAHRDAESQRQSQEALAAERDALREAMAEAVQRRGVVERECDALRVSSTAARAADEEETRGRAAAEGELKAKIAEHEALAVEFAAERDALRAALADSVEQRGAAQKENDALRISLEDARAEERRSEEAALSRTVATDELRRKVAEQEQELAGAAQLRERLAGLEADLATVRNDAETLRAEAKRWGEKAALLEADQGTACARLRRAEANVELLESQLEEVQREVEQLQADVEAKERRLAAVTGRAT